MEDPDDEEARRIALAIHLKCPLGDVEKAVYGDHTYEADSEEWLICTEDEADKLWDEGLDSYLDDCGILDEVPENLRNYFDREAWKRDAKHDGRGHVLSGYDGEEVDSKGFVLFRIN